MIATAVDFILIHVSFIYEHALSLNRGLCVQYAGMLTPVFLLFSCSDLYSYTFLFTLVCLLLIHYDNNEVLVVLDSTQ